MTTEGKSDMDTFTAQDGVTARCGGLNHSDYGVIVTHDRCGASVARREDGRVFDIHLTESYGARKYTCWNSRHVCDVAMVELVAAEKAARVAAGCIEKGCTVIVTKGRKVAKGVTGIVFWKGTDAYGTAKLGLRTSAGETVWVAENNCQLS